LAIAVVVVLALVANTRVYFLRDYAGGTVLWNTSEAYFFLNSSRLGHSVSYYRYPWFLLKEFLGAVEPPDEEVASLVIVKVTANKIERHSLRLDRTARGPGSDPGRFTPVNGIVYANCPMLDGLCRWAGDHFERATAEERGRIGDSMALNSTDIQEPIDGWSRREFGAGRSGPTFEIGLEGDTKISIKNVVGPNSQEAVVSIYVGRSDGTPGKIAEFEARSGRVTRSDYRRALQPSD
jgi:hypothetical protein